MLHLLVYVNNICSRECPECYYPKGNDEMSLDIRKELPLWIANILEEERVKQFKIHFIGGEPLYSFKAMKLIYQNVMTMKPKECLPNSEAGWLTFTNGDLLTFDILNDIKKMKMRVLLNPTYDSLDGVEEKIKMVKSICGGCALAIALDELNLSRLTQLTELAIKHNCHMRTNRLYNGGTISGYVDEYEKQMKKMFDLLLKAENPMWPNFIMESTYPTWKGQKNCYSCGKWFLTIDPDGTIRSCNADLDTKVGHILINRNWSSIKFRQRWSAKNLPECQDCEWITWCQGGCPYTRKLAYGTYEHKSPFCSAFKNLFPMLMELTKIKEESLWL